jgi:hypothetical protein
MRMRSVAIRLRIRLVREGKSVDVVALINSGYETREPEVLLPVAIATQLSIYPRLPEGATVKEYRLADGSVTKLIRISRAVQIYVVEEDRVVGPVEASVVVAEKAEEVLISDKLAGKLGIVALDFGEGLWCFRDEIGRVTRRSR